MPVGVTGGETDDADVDRRKGVWRAKWPNPADLNFDFFTLLKADNDSPVAQLKKVARNKRIAVIGAGIAGVTAARELVRCGFKNVHLFEATDRIGGRLYSRPINEKDLRGTPTTYELGAMRIPFFPKPGKENSVADYYVSMFDIKTQDFPNPGAPGVRTAVYMHDGLGPDPRNKEISPIIYTRTDASNAPTINDRVLRSVEAKWQDFKRRAQSVFEQEYHRQELKPREKLKDTPDAKQSLSNWQLFWRQVEQTYWKIDFRDLVTRPGIIDPEKPWDFGGMGMNPLEADVFATIGAGDGGWGPFYDVSALWVIRTLLFGYGEYLQLVIGKTSAGNGPLAIHFKTIRCNHKAEVPKLQDSRRSAFKHPIFLGVQSLAECMLFEDLKSPGLAAKSFFDLATSNKVQLPSMGGIGLFMNTEVTKIGKVFVGPDEKFEIHFTYFSDSTPVQEGKRGQPQFALYDYVILTAPSWAVQQLITLDLGPNVLPKEVKKTLNSSHWIASKKCFFPLKSQFWNNPGNSIPQVWVSDNLLQGVYAYGVNHYSVPEAQRDNGAILISYTWEDDALKLLPYQDKELKRKCIEQFDKMLKDFDIGVTAKQIIQTTERNGVTEIDYESGYVFEWLQQRSFRGCAKLYRAVTYQGNYDIARHNQDRGEKSGLLFAGSSYSLDDGWIEPAMRLALDTVLRISHAQEGTAFKSTFDWNQYLYYPRWDTELPKPDSDESD